MTFRPSTLAYVSNVRFTSASDLEVESGLLGWLSFDLSGSLRLDGVAMRRTLDGRLALSFPGRKDRRGQIHLHVRPLDDHIRRDIEHQIFSRLRREIMT